MFWVYWTVGLTISTVLGAYVVRKDKFIGYAALSCFFAIYVIAANILVPRLVNVDLGVGVYLLTTGSIIWPFTAQAIDMVNEIYGKKKAYVTAILTYTLNLILISFVYMGLQAVPLWDAAQESWWVGYFTATPRVFIASGISFLVCIFVDIIVFDKLKRLFKNIEEKALPAKWIGLVTIRSFTTDLLNMVMDALVFTTIAFLGLIPHELLWTLIGSSMIAKILLALYDTPWFTAFRLLTKDVEREF